MKDLLVNYLVVGAIFIVTLSIFICTVIGNKKRRFKKYVFTSFTRYDSHIVIGKLPTCPKLLTTKSGEKINTENILEKDLFITSSGNEWILVDRKVYSGSLKPKDEVVLEDEITKLHYLAVVEDSKTLTYSFLGKENSGFRKFSYYGKVICKNKLKDEGCSYYYYQ